MKNMLHTYNVCMEDIVEKNIEGTKQGTFLYLHACHIIRTFLLNYIFNTQNTIEMLKDTFIMFQLLLSD